MSTESRNCAHCKCSITLVASLIKCKCKCVFCDKHRPPEKHSCAFDYVSNNKARLRKDLDRTPSSSVPLSPSTRPTKAGHKLLYNRLHPHVRDRAIHAITFCILTVGLLVGLVATSARVLAWTIAISIGVNTLNHYLHRRESRYSQLYRVKHYPITPSTPRDNHGWYGKAVHVLSPHSRGCMWSASVWENPVWTLCAEWDNLLDMRMRLLDRWGLVKVRYRAPEGSRCAPGPL